MEPNWNRATAHTPATAINPLEIVSLVGRRDPVILDIGCNDGMHTQMFLDLFDGARVYCFEPDPRAQRRFREKINGHTRATMFPMAVGAVDGEIAFFPSSGDGVVQPNRDWDYSGSIRKPKNHLTAHPWCRFGLPIYVPITRLDSWAAHFDIGRVDFVWADVQGAEVDLIGGGLETLGRTRFFFTEYSDHELYEGQARLDALLGMLPGFEVVHVYPEDVLLRNTAIR